jgi:acetyl-CoA synthetase
VPEVYVALKPGIAPSETIEKAVINELETLIGKIARPRSVRIVPDMPKTRSGKIMRRVLAAISNKMPVGDTTTLANPEVVEQIRIMVQGAGPVETTAVVADDIAKFGKDE